MEVKRQAAPSVLQRKQADRKEQAANSASGLGTKTSGDGAAAAGSKAADSSWIFVGENMSPAVIRRTQEEQTCPLSRVVEFHFSLPEISPRRSNSAGGGVSLSGGICRISDMLNFRL